MRPERSRETGRAPRVARARLLVKAHLAWLGGYPTEQGWCLPPSAGRQARTASVDRAGLHRATRALNELEVRLADVLGDVFPEPRAWVAGARAAIELLKPAGAGVRPTPDAPLATGLFRREVVAAVRAAPPSLHPVLDAASWIALAQPARLGALLRATLACGDAVAALQAELPREKAQEAALHLVLLADEEGGGRVEPLARLLASRALYQVPTRGVEYARTFLQAPRAERPARPAATLGPSLATWTTALLAMEGRPRRRVLALLGALDLSPAAATWAAWWTGVEHCEHLARAQPETDNDIRARAKAARLVERAPRALHGQSLTTVLGRTLAWPDALHREALRALAELPAVLDTVAVRLAFLEHWTLLAADASAAKVAPLVGLFARYLARMRRCEARLAPWGRILRRDAFPSWSSPPDEALLEHVPTARWPLFYEALGRAVEEPSPGNTGADVHTLCRALVIVVPLERDAVHALALARELAPHVSQLGSGDVRDALELFGQDAVSFGKVAALLARVEREQRDHLLHGLQAVRRSGGDDLARSLLLDESQRLVSCGRRLAVLALAGGARDLDAVRTVPVDPPWVASYPAWIAPSLRRLAEAEVHAERAARRLLGDHVRATPVVRRELAHLEALAARPQGVSERMRGRIANLRARLASPGAPSAALRAHLVAKVERAARRAKLARIEGALDASLRRRLTAFLGVDPAPPWLFTPRTLEQLAPIGTFDPPVRALALRVLRMRAGPPPWDLRDDPANRAFLERLRRSGVDVAPWLDGVGTVQVTTAGGKTLDLRLEEDPLEILDMGRHFATCLSPGAINYFSTFANIADVNKRVLFGRDPSGTVVARCLLALSATGALVAFNPYAHDGTLGFGAIVATFAVELAARMRIIVLPHADVPRLAAPEWYDDGPVDLGGRFPFLQDGAPFRASLATVAPAAFVDEARRLFAPLPLGALTLPLLVALPEAKARPELLAPLVPDLAATEGLPIETLASALHLLARTPGGASATRALVPCVDAWVRRAGEDAHAWVETALMNVVDVCPSDVLRLLRTSKMRGARSWTDEHRPRRLEMAGRAYEALHRPRMAVTLYRLAARRAGGELQKTVTERADALEATLAR